MTGNKDLGTQENMLDLFEILRGHHSASGNNEKIIVFYAIFSYKQLSFMYG